MKNISIEFTNKPKVVFENAELTIKDTIFIVKTQEGAIKLFPFNNVVCVTEE